jgi:transposase InsO family protein
MPPRPACPHLRPSHQKPVGTRFVSNAARRSDDTNGYHTLTSLSSSELKSVPSFDSSSGTSAASLTAAGGTQRGFPGLLPHTRNSAAIPTCSHKIARAYPKFAGLRAAAATVAHFLRAGCQTGFQRSTNLSGRHDMTTYVAHISTFSKTHNTTHKQRHVCRRAAHSLATGSGPLLAPVRIFGTSGAEFPGGDMRSADRKVEPLSVMLRVYIRPQNQVVLLPPHLRRRECDSTTPGHGQCNVAPSAEQLTSVMRMRNTFAPTHTHVHSTIYVPTCTARRRFALSNEESNDSDGICRSCGSSVESGCTCTRSSSKISSHRQSFR